ncbi:unannotated protein [freshwater metagenome]|uniref:Unannotated protein n=1 Tax=freshwater metagenome TaxID=449393 RepID=A0A6J6N1L4_9ZZZZ
MGLESDLKHSSSVPEVLRPQCVCALRLDQGVVARNHCVRHCDCHRRGYSVAVCAHSIRCGDASSCRRSRVAPTQWWPPRTTGHDFVGRRLIPRRACRNPHPADDRFGNERGPAHPSCYRCICCRNVRSPAKPPAHPCRGTGHRPHDDLRHRLLPEQVDLVEFVP